METEEGPFICLFYAGAACMRMWVLLARGRCGVPGAQVAYEALWPLVIM